MLQLPHISPVPGVPGLWRIAADTNGYLLVREGESLLIDCPEADVAAALRAAGLPAPSTVLHTQVQTEHCGEWAAFPDAAVFVAAESRDMAVHAPAFFAATDTVWPPDRDWDYKGAEKYGIGGCVTERLPAQPLAVAGTLAPGETFTWEDITLEILPLPASGKRSIGLFWRTEGALFSGDLLHAGGLLPNAYDLERCHGLPTGYLQLRRALTMVDKLHARLLLPTTGPLIDAPHRDITALKGRIAWVTHPPALRVDEAVSPINYTPPRTFSHLRQVADGIYQNTDAGNLVVFVSDDGAGLLLDPCPCVWPTWEEGEAGMHADLDLLEREAGLKRVELALITHFHGDHLQFCDLLRGRYGTTIAATPDVAELMENPAAYHLPFAVDWYGYPFKSVAVDELFPYELPRAWRETAITPVRLPGHCFAHAAFLLPWRDRRIACTGDTLQYGAGPIAVGMPNLYYDTAWPARGFLPGFERLAAYRPDLVLCAHSQSFFDPDGAILADWQTAATASLARARAMVAGDLTTAMTPPGFDALREKLLRAKMR